MNVFFVTIGLLWFVHALTVEKKLDEIVSALKDCRAMMEWRREQ